MQAWRWEVQKSQLARKHKVFITPAHVRTLVHAVTVALITFNAHADGSVWEQHRCSQGDEKWTA